MLELNAFGFKTVCRQTIAFDSKMLWFRTVARNPIGNVSVGSDCDLNQEKQRDKT